MDKNNFSLVYDAGIEDAIIEGDMEAVRSLLEKGVNADTRFDDFTLLISAGFYGQTDIVELLLDPAPQK